MARDPFQPSKRLLDVIESPAMRMIRESEAITARLDPFYEQFRELNRQLAPTLGAMQVVADPSLQASLKRMSDSAVQAQAAVREPLQKQAEALAGIMESPAMRAIADLGTSAQFRQMAELARWYSEGPQIAGLAARYEEVAQRLAGLETSEVAAEIQDLIDCSAPSVEVDSEAAPPERGFVRRETVLVIVLFLLSECHSVQMEERLTGQINHMLEFLPIEAESTEQADSWLLVSTRQAVIVYAEPNDGADQLCKLPDETFLIQIRRAGKWLQVRPALPQLKSFETGWVRAVEVLDVASDSGR
jgi:hypothetical protein